MKPAPRVGSKADSKLEALCKKEVPGRKLAAPAFSDGAMDLRTGNRIKFAQWTVQIYRIDVTR
jgi:hypothetical protein